MILANYGRKSFDNVIVPWAAGCQVMGILAYRQISENPQRAVIGLTDISARKNVKKQLGADIFTFTVPYRMFIEMEENLEGSFLQRPTWFSLVSEE